MLLRASATMRSDYAVLGEILPTAGKHLVVTAAIFLTVDDAGKITHIARVRDNLDIIRQLGIPPERMRALVAKLEERLSRAA